MPTNNCIKMLILRVIEKNGTVFADIVDEFTKRLQITKTVKIKTQIIVDFIIAHPMSAGAILAVQIYDTTFSFIASSRQTIAHKNSSKIWYKLTKVFYIDIGERFFNFIYFNGEPT